MKTKLLFKWSSLWLLLLLLTMSQQARAEQKEDPDAYWKVVCCANSIEYYSRILYNYDYEHGYMNQQDRELYKQLKDSGCELIVKIEINGGCGHNDFWLTWDAEDPYNSNSGNLSDHILFTSSMMSYQVEPHYGFCPGYGLDNDIVLYIEGNGYKAVTCYLGYKNPEVDEKTLYIFGTNDASIHFDVDNNTPTDVSNHVFISWWDSENPYSEPSLYNVNDEFIVEYPNVFDEEEPLTYSFAVDCDPCIEVISFIHNYDALYPSETIQLPNGRTRYKVEFCCESYCDQITVKTKLNQQPADQLNIECFAGVEIMNGGDLINENDEDFDWVTNDVAYQELKAAGYPYIYCFGVEPGCSYNQYSLSWYEEDDSFYPYSSEESTSENHSFYYPGITKLYDKNGYLLPDGQPGYPAGYTPNKDIAIYIGSAMGDMDLTSYPGIMCYIGFKNAEETEKILYVHGTNQRNVDFWIEGEGINHPASHVTIMIFGEDIVYDEAGDVYNGSYDFDYYYSKYGDTFWFTVECDPGYEITRVESNNGEWELNTNTEVKPDGSTIYKIETPVHRYDLCINFWIYLTYHGVIPVGDCVDLGLPSGTLWATTNVEASSPEKTGNLYAWGEKETKSTYTWKNYKYCSGTSSTCKYIGDDISKSDYDIAYSLYKDFGECIPTAKQWNELISLCTWKESKKNGVKGYLVTGPNGQSIFLPFTGCSYDGKEYGAGTYAYYWTANNVSSNKSKAQGASIKTGTTPSIVSLNRRTGVAIRPVITPMTEENTVELVDLGLSVKWGNQNLGADSETGYGDYYAWGETETKSTYTWKNYEYANGTANSAQNIGSDISQTTYDAAFKANESLTMPTAAQWKELIEKCTWKEETKEGVKGFRVTGPSGKSIFLPLSGCSYDGKNVGVGISAYYWTSEKSASNASKAKASYLKSGATTMVTTIQRRTGAAIRPVESVEQADYVDLGLVSGNLWASCNLGAGSEEQAGNYYAWGETAPKSNYTWKNYKYANGSATTVQGIGNKISGNASFDSAVGKQVVLVKGNVTYTLESQMPSEADLEELYNLCNLKQETVNGVAGIRFSRNGKSIFLPYTGSWYDGKKHDVGTSAYYWSGDVNTSNAQQANTLNIKSGEASVMFCRRRTGLPIRPVYVVKRAYANSAEFDTDGINIIHQATSQDDAIYNLQGIKMEGQLQPGIYIRNGKKFVVK